MFGIGMPEMLLILAVALIVIGPKKLPELAKSLGRALGEFKKATSDLKQSLEIDGDLKDVKDTLNDINTDIRSSVKGASNAAADKAPAVDKNANAEGSALEKLSQAFQDSPPAVDASAESTESDGSGAPGSEADTKKETPAP